MESEKISKSQNTVKSRGNWVRYIVHHMMAGCKNPEDFLNNNHVTFVTFNYDTSLEKNLYTSLSQNDFFPDKKMIEELLSEDRIIHVYGKMKESTYEPDAVSFSYAFLNDFKKWKHKLDPAYDAAEGLLTIAPGDKIKDKKALDLAMNAVRNAEEVFILGYGFDKLNSENIGLSEYLKHSFIIRGFGSESRVKYKGKRVYFTNYNNKNVVSKKASQIFYSNPSEFLPPNGLISSDKRRSVHYEMSTKNVFYALGDDFEFVD